jgi:hypothetical protein
MIKVYNNLIPEELQNIKKVTPIKKVEGDRSYLDDVFPYEYSSEEDDKEILTYDSRGKLVHIKLKNKTKEKN